MAKLGLLFVAVFCVVQISLAARLPRETEEGNSTEASFFDKVKGSFGQLSDSISKTFTKENADKIVKSVSDGAEEFGNKAKETYQELADKASDKFSEIKKDISGNPDGTENSN
ncbi:uncharacterized protein LOC129565534 [Sitodiplosis mosellana]|uniref:uncharacterized protein LOC129565534 n=1 Tax=Sitodiplosis mosellana TaxID=263140 RepID=UPI0024450881|nr:uncharacterized protein LOC129565534 [Sitodiplosis mosellana]